MDPDETMRLLRDRMIDVSDMVSMRLRDGGSSLTEAQLREVVENARLVVEHGEDLLEWIAKVGFIPRAS